MNPQYKINLTKTFNKAFSAYDRNVRDQLRGILSNASFREMFTKRVIDRIVERTSESGVDRNGKKFAPYSKSYMQSDVFKIYSKSSKVNLELTGEMLSSMRGLDKAQSIIIQMVDQENKAKASGHVYGIRKKGGGKVIRDFLGLPQDEESKLFEETLLEFQDENFSTAVELFRGQDAVTTQGQVGNQPAFNVNLSMQDILSGIERNLADE